MKKTHTKTTNKQTSKQTNKQTSLPISTQTLPVTVTFPAAFSTTHTYKPPSDSITFEISSEYTSGLVFTIFIRPQSERGRQSFIHLTEGLGNPSILQDKVMFWRLTAISSLRFSRTVGGSVKERKRHHCQIRYFCYFSFISYITCGYFRYFDFICYITCWYFCYFGFIRYITCGYFCYFGFICYHTCG